MRAFCTQNGQNTGVDDSEFILCLVGVHKMRFIFLNSMGSQLSNAHSIIKIGQKLASVRYFKIRTRTIKIYSNYNAAIWFFLEAWMDG